VLARIGRPHGVRGALKLNQIGLHLATFVAQKVFVGDKALTLRNLNGEIATFEEIKDRDAAATLTNLEIAVPQQELTRIIASERLQKPTLLTDLYYLEMIGLRVSDAHSNQPIGRIITVEDLDENTLVTVADENGIEFLVPVDYPHWQKLDLAAGEIALAEWQALKESQLGE